MAKERIRRLGGHSSGWGFRICNAQYEDEMPVTLSPAIHPDEFRQSIGRINAYVVLPRAHRWSYWLLLANLYAACVWMPVVAATVGATSPSLIFPFVIFVIVASVLSLGLLVLMRNRIIDRSRRQLRAALAVENANYANRQPPVSWLCDESTVLVNRADTGNNGQMLFDIIVEVGQQPGQQQQIVFVLPVPGQSIAPTQGGLALAMQPHFPQQHLPQHYLPNPQFQPQFPQQPQQWMAPAAYAEQPQHLPGVTAHVGMNSTLLDDATQSDQ